MSRSCRLHRQDRPGSSSGPGMACDGAYPCHHNHFEDARVAKDVEVALAALTTITGLQQQGHAPMPL